MTLTRKGRQFAKLQYYIAQRKKERQALAHQFRMSPITPSADESDDHLFPLYMY